MRESVIRTVVPLVVAVLLGQAARVGLSLPEGAVTEVVTVVVGTVYYAVVRTLERQRPGIGRWLLGAGLTRKQPVYTTEMGIRR